MALLRRDVVSWTVLLGMETQWNGQLDEVLLFASKSPIQRDEEVNVHRERQDVAQGTQCAQA
jgi:hypothetical protein